jgi:hypothetical protein
MMHTITSPCQPLWGNETTVASPIRRCASQITSCPDTPRPFCERFVSPWPDRLAPEARQEGSPGRKPWVGWKNDRAPVGATQIRWSPGIRLCRASGASLHLSTFPSANALGYLLNAPPALSPAVPSLLNRLKFVALCYPTTPRWLGLTLVSTGKTSA